MHKKYPKKIIWLPFSQKLETQLYAASDMFLLPSSHEPCGINQLIAMRYGCVPIVRKVGGLHNTVDDFSPTKNRGTGFVFKTFSEVPLYGAIVRALENYKYKEVWHDIAVRCMQQSNSWEIPAKKYVALYRKAIKLNGNK
jgi:starch synthase